MTRTHRTIRPCPICGIAMQGAKSRESIAHFDVFRCLVCSTTIHDTTHRDTTARKPTEHSPPRAFMQRKDR